jgi:WD40 repeat protein
VGQHQTKGPAKALQFTPDGKKLVLSTESGDLTVLQLDGSVFLNHRLEDPARCIATDGRRVVLGTPLLCCSVWSSTLLTPRRAGNYPSYTGTTGGYVSVVHLSSGSEAARYSASRTKAVNCLAVPADASRIVAGCEDSYLHIWSC